MTSREARNPLLANDELAQGRSSASSSEGGLTGKSRGQSFEISPPSPKLGGSPKKLATSSEDVEAGPVDHIPSSEQFEYSHGLSTAEAARRLAHFGPNCLPEVKIPKWCVRGFDSLLRARTLFAPPRLVFSPSHD